MEEVRETEVQKVKSNLEQIDTIDTIKHLIETNEAHFEYQGIKYKVRRPTYQDRQELSKKRSEKHIELLRAKNTDGTFKYLAEADLRKLYKERGIDIGEIDIKIENYQIKERDLLLKLGKLLKSNPNESEIQIYKDEIQTIRTSISLLVTERTNLLDISIDQQMMVFIYSYFAYLLTDKSVDEKWVHAWNTFDEFLNADERLVNQAGTYSTLLISDQLINNDLK